MRKVLLLEEDATYAAEIRRGLSGLGVEVVLIRDGSVGLARAVSERFDLILVSAELPAVNGFRFCNRVRKDPNAGKVPIFLMGNVDEELKMHRQLPTRADDYFKKPVVLAELVARMRLCGVTDEAAPDDEVTAARVGLAGVGELQAKLVEQETAIGNLNRELAQARATATRFEAQSKEIERLRRALDDARKAPGQATGKALSGAYPAAALAGREKQLAEQTASADAARVKLAAAEGENQTLKARARDQERILAAQKKQLETSAAERDAARKEIEELAAERSRWNGARTELETELADVRRQCDDLDVKRREVTRALSELSRRVAAAADERARLAKRAADAESRSARLEADLASSHERLAAEQAAREAAERAKDEAAAASSEPFSTEPPASNERVEPGEQTLSEALDDRARSLAEALDRVSQECEEQRLRIESLESELEAARGRQAAALEAEWQGRLVVAVNEAKRAAYAKHDAELDALLSRFVEVEHDRAEIQAAFEQTLRDVELSMERTRAELEDERKAHGDTRAAHAKKVDAANALLAGRNQAMLALEREAEQARAEITELEAEIVVLRSELLGARRELEAVQIGIRARDDGNRSEP